MLTTKTLSFTGKLYKKSATLYIDDTVTSIACIIYFHGGGMLFGNREDLPNLHLQSFTQAGFPILALDYPLAPAARLDDILEDAFDSVKEYLSKRIGILGSPIPYVLWGRSAGAYLALLTATKGAFSEPPAAILSYYGYGFLCEGWFMEPSKYYSSLPIKASYNPECMKDPIHADGSLDTHYMNYVYARQSGEWKNLIYEGRDKFFYRDFTLRLVDSMPCPLFAAHSTGDSDVPYREFLALCEKYPAKRFVATVDAHDFDREENGFFTKQLLSSTIDFLNERLSK